MSNYIAMFWNDLKQKIHFFSKKNSIIAVGGALSAVIVFFVLLQWVIGDYVYNQVFTNTPLISHFHHSAINLKKKDASIWFKELHFFSLWEIQSRDKLAIRAYFLPAKGVSGEVVILLHGYHQTPEDLFELAKMYHEKFGFHVLIPGLRGQLPSEGKTISFGWNDRHDVQDWIQLLNKRLDRQAQIILHGCSSGASTAIMAASADATSISAVIADSSFYTLKDFIEKEHSTLFSGFWKSFLFTKLEQKVQLQQGFKISDIVVSNYLQSCKPPVLFINGLQDAIVAPNLAYDLRNAPSPTGSKRLLSFFEGAQHAQSFDQNPQGYEKTVRYFLHSDHPTNNSFFSSSTISDDSKDSNVTNIEKISGVQWIV